MIAWSYSAIKTFDQCAKKYYHLRVSKDVADPPSKEMDYGTDVHKAAEDYVKSGVPIPAKYGYLKPIVEKLNQYTGDKYCELKLGVTEDHKPCEFFAPDVWLRTVIDLLVVNGDKGRLIDYKTGKNARYADTKQLDIMAGAAFVHFPNLMVIKSGLLYVVSGDFITRTHVRTEKSIYLNTFEPELARLSAAFESGVWNPTSSGLCGWCPVEQCEHWRPRR